MKQQLHLHYLIFEFYTTFAMKEIHPDLWMKNHIKCHNFFAAQAELEHKKIVHEVQAANQLIMEI